MEMNKIINAVKEMSVLEVSKLVKALEEEFGVSAAAAIAAAPAAAVVVEEKTSFNISLETIGANKIAVIKVVKDILGLGLKESKDLVDAAPKMLKENVPIKDAKEWEAKLVEAGATVKLV